MEKKILGEKVAYYTNIIEDMTKFSSTLLEIDKEWEAWSASNDKSFIYGETKTFDINQINSLEEPIKSNMLYIYNVIMDTFYKVCKDYAEDLNDFDEPRLFPVFNIKKYYAGVGMGAHYDQLDGDKTLKYSLVMYLNDNFEGGEISFKITDYSADKVGVGLDYETALKNNEFDFGVKPEAGSIIIFPSSAPYYHIAHLVKSGNKYMIPGHWIHNDMPMRNGSM
jgi:hypothetical protein